MVIYILIGLSCVSAAEVNQTLSQNVLTSHEMGNFTDLNDEISKIPTNGNLTLTKDYSYNSNDSDYKNGVLINKDNIVIDGGGHTIDGAGQARIFNITSNNVTLKNINFINGYSNENGGSISAVGNLNIINSTFKNNSAYYGGAIYFDDVGQIINCKFNNNTIADEYGDGGAVYFNNEGTVTNSVFINNTAEYGAGAVYFDKNGTVHNSIFTNNTAENDGGAIYFNENGTITDCNFTNNTAGYYGGAVYIWRDGKIKNSKLNGNSAQNGGSLYVHGAGYVNNCNFTDNNARTGGAIELWVNGTVNNSIFTDNAAKFSGGAIYVNDGVKINNCNFTDNSAEEYAGGALYIFSIVNMAECNFINNTASVYGGSIYFNQNGTIDKSTFKSNKANDGGAIFACGNLLINACSFKDNVASVGTNDISLKDNATVFYVVSLTISPIVDVIYGNAVKISVNVSYDDAVINTGNASVIIGNKRYSAEVVNGYATIEIPDLNVGSYACEVNFTDGANYTGSGNIAFNVIKNNLTVSADNKAYVINYGGKYSITVKDINNNLLSNVKVTFTLNGKTIATSTTNSNGVATISLTAKMLKTAKAGKKNLIIKTDSANYNSITKTVKITINKEKTKLTAKAKKFKRLSKTKKYTIFLKNSKGKAIIKAKVTLKVKGKTYVAKTNSKGKATFKIKKLTKKGKFKATVKFAGNANYRATSKKVQITIR